MSGLDPYYSRHDTDGMGPLPALALIVMGLALGMVIMALARSCDRRAEPVVVGLNQLRCSFCHYERVALLDSTSKYKAHHQKKRSMAFNEAAEREYLSRLIAGSQP